MSKRFVGYKRVGSGPWKPVVETVTETPVTAEAKTPSKYEASCEFAWSEVEHGQTVELVCYLEVAQGRLSHS